MTKSKSAKLESNKKAVEGEVVQKSITKKTGKKSSFKSRELLTANKSSNADLKFINQVITILALVILICLAVVTLRFIVGALATLLQIAIICAGVTLITFSLYSLMKVRK